MLLSSHEFHSFLAYDLPPRCSWASPPPSTQDSARHQVGSTNVNGQVGQQNKKSESFFSPFLLAIIG